LSFQTWQGHLEIFNPFLDNLKPAHHPFTKLIIMKDLKKMLLVFFVLLIGFGVIAQLPDPGFTVNDKTALLITDPQIDFLSPDGVTWGVVGESVTENNTVENIGTLFQLAQDNNIPTFVSPHYYYPHDHNWKFEGALEKLMHNINMFQRKDPLSLEGFENSGADFMPQYKKYIAKAIVVSPHKVYGPETNDLVLQLRKQGIDKVILAGMSANLCVEAHMRELLEQGFEVAVVKDATAAAKLPDMDAYAAALINFRMMANHVYSLDELQNELKN
jgi:nicotinamidase-related amidase